MRYPEVHSLFVPLFGFVSAMALSGCDAPFQSVSSNERSSQRYASDLPDGGRLTLWVMHQASAEGQPSMSVRLDDPIERSLLIGTSQARTADSLHVVFNLRDGGTSILRAVMPREGPLHIAYTRKGAPAAMEMDLAVEADDPVFSPRTISKKTEPTKDPEAAEDGGYEEMGIAELGQEISLNVLTITRADGSRHPLDSLLEQYVCGKANTYDRFLDALKDGPFSYELGTTLSHRGTDRVCLSISVHEQWPGAAHGMFGTRILNYDLAHNSIIGLWDVVDRKKRGALIAACSKSFYAQHPDKNKREFPFKLTENVALLRDGIEFLYPPYEMGAFVEGEISFYMPFAQLAPMMRKDSPFAQTSSTP